MKIRNGFVSNSSSSSFIIAKAYLTKDQVQAILDFHKKMDENEVYFGDDGNQLYDDDCYIRFECRNIADKLEKMLTKMGIQKKHYLMTDG
jgi:hypothetical protein